MLNLIEESCHLFQVTRLPIGPITVGRPRGANLGSMGNHHHQMKTLKLLNVSNQQSPKLKDCSKLLEESCSSSTQELLNKA